jgi:hypothetical protein
MITRSFTGPLPFVWSEDPALDPVCLVERETQPGKDKEPSDYAAFLKTNDVTALSVRDGLKLTVFEIKPLTKKQKLQVYAKASTLEQMDEAIAWGLRAVRGNEAFGFPFEVKHDKQDRVEADVLENLNDEILWLEMGARIMEISRLFPRSGSR